MAEAVVVSMARVHLEWGSPEQTPPIAVNDRLALVPDLSVIIITKNEVENVSAALKSVAWANERLVVDSGSTDDTVSIARRYADRVVSHAWEGYGAQKNFATRLAANDWVLSIDADERVPQSLAEEIQDLMRTGPSKDGYRIPRMTRYLGRWIRSTDWYPDPQLRLYDRRVSCWSASPAHESVTVDGSVGLLRSALHHHAYRDLSHHLDTIDRYTTLVANQMFVDGRRAGWTDLFVRPQLTFLRNYVIRLGVRDGYPGLIVSLLNSYYVLLKYAKLWEQQRSKGSDH